MKTKEELTKEILVAHWIDMRFHLEQGNVFAVSPKINLTEVGVAIASDHSAQVVDWVKNGDLVRLEKFDRFEKEDLFAILIIQPFVLAQKVEKEE